MSNHRRSSALLHSGFVYLDADRGLSTISDGDTCLLQRRTLTSEVNACHRLRHSISYDFDSGGGLQVQVHRGTRRLLVYQSTLTSPS